MVNNALPSDSRASIHQIADIRRSTICRIIENLSRSLVLDQQD